MSDGVGNKTGFVISHNTDDDLLKDDDNNPAADLLICRSGNQTEIQWAFKGITTPSDFSSHHNIHIENIVTQLPTSEQLQKQINHAEAEFTLRK